MDEKELLSIAQQAEKEGDTETAIEAYDLITKNKLDSASFIDKAIGAGEAALGAGEAALSVGSGIASGLGGGLAYAATVPFAGDEAAQFVKSGVEESLTYEPRTEQGQAKLQGFGEVVSDAIAPVQEIAEDVGFTSEQLGEAQFQRNANPISATFEYMAPQIVTEAAALLTGGVASRLLKNRASKSEGKANQLKLDADEILNPAEGVKFERAAETIKAAKPEDIAALVNSDPSVLSALQDLGLEDLALASYSSRNPQYRAIEQGLASMDASELSLQQKNFIEALGKKADDIIEESGGSIDTPVLSKTIKEDMAKAIEDSYQAETMIYDSMRKHLPFKTRVPADNTLRMIERLAEDAGGIEKLKPLHREIYKALKPEITEGVRAKKGKMAHSIIKGTHRLPDVPGTPSTSTNPTYGLLDMQRKRIGEQLGRKMDKAGMFKDADAGELSQLYKALKDDQSLAINAQNIPELSTLQKNADALTFKRKRMEKDSKDIMGKGLDKEIINVLGAAVKGLGKGDLTKFQNVMEKIPEKYKGQAVLSAMHNVFKGTAATKQALGDAQFATFWTQLERSPAVKAELFKHLPPSSRKPLENLGKVTKAVNKAQQDKITTGRIKEFLDDRSGTLNQMANKLVGPIIGFAASKVVPGGSMAGAGVKHLLENTTDAAQAANAMMARNDFQRIVTQAVTDGVTDGMKASAKLKAMEKSLANSKQYQNWADKLETGDKALLARVGIATYLMRPRKEQEAAQ